MSNKNLSIIEQLSNTQGLSKSFISTFSQIFTEVDYPKNYKLFQEGKPTTKIWIIQKGLVGYYYHQADKEHLGWIDDEGEMVASIRSIGMGLPVQETAKLLEDSILLEMNFKDLEESTIDPLDLEKCKTAIYQYYFLALEERLKSFQSMDAKARYLKLLKEKPSLLQRVSLQQIASFLGVTPETLSRIRAEIA